MKLGMPQLYEFDTVEENLELAQELGLDFIELNLNFGYCRKEMEAGGLASLLASYNLEATLHFYDEADFGSYDEVVDAYLALLEKYASLGQGYIKQVNVHLNPGPVVTIAGVKNYIYDKEFEEYAARLASNLYKARQILEPKGINLVIENTDNTPEFLMNAYRFLLQEGYRFCYDIGHDHLSHDVLWNLISELPLPFDEFHVHDAKGRSKCHLALGEGELDVAKFKRLAEENDAYVVLEVKQAEDLRVSVPIFRSL